ncbi:BT4734/BF3469 family protein [Bathymodiolus japonicus methanotrophic gill symbiont]|uniref:BT4734/BF3469 family protein n=1 Tax=Bathymodiolus japonicus methanotrophic gill symbiont TaxID=113269 RepID=UPI001C8DF89D
MNNDADFKQAYFQIESLFKTWGYETDPACKDISRKCFLCHDADVFYNPDADIYKLKPFQEIAPKPLQYAKNTRPTATKATTCKNALTSS